MSKIGISHDMSSFDENSTILTLEDKPIIGESGKLDESDDVLYNENIRETEKAVRNARRKAKLLDEEDPFGDSLLLNPNNILKKYDQKDENISKERFRVRLENDSSSQTGNLVQADALLENERLRQKLREGRSILADLRADRELSSDYYTVEEAVRAGAMPHPQKGPQKLKCRRKMAEQDCVQDANSGNAGTENWVRQGKAPENIFEAEGLEKPIEVVSRGSRRMRKESQATTSGQPSIEVGLQGAAGGEKAVDLEKMRAQQRDELAKLREEEKRVERSAPDGEFDAEDDVEFQKVLASQRQWRSGFKDVAEIARRIRENAAKQNADSSRLDRMRRAVYNETEDFLNNVTNYREQNEKELYKEETVGETLKAVHENEADENGEGGSGNIQVRNNEENKDHCVKDEKILDEPLAGSSVSDALKLFRMRGLLKKKDIKDYIGRENDEKPSFFKEEHDPAPEIKLEYLDPITGKPMTRKQAFRNMSHIFHGRKPSEVKKTKIGRHVANRLQRREKASTETPTGLVSKAKKLTKAKGLPYIPLDQNKNTALLELMEDFGKFDRLGEKTKENAKKKRGSKKAKKTKTSAG